MLENDLTEKQSFTVFIVVIILTGLVEGYPI
jgi:hypothetical protein